MFRLLAPAATSVTLGGDFPIGSNVAMTRDDTGVWSVTVGPLKADFYSYFFTVDGVRTLDWRNVSVMRDGARYASWLRIPGPESADYQVNDVPHGTVSQVWYPSPTLGHEAAHVRLHAARLRDRQYQVPGPLPAPRRRRRRGGLDRAGARAADPRQPDRAGTIQADDRRHDQRQRDAVRLAGLRSAARRPRGIPAKACCAFPESLVKDVIPFVDTTYRTKPDRENRAVAGLSMGGAQALYAGFNNLDLFAWIGALSGGFPLLPGVAIDIPAPANAATLRGPDISRSIDPAKYLALHPALDASVNSKLRLFYLAIGLDDGLITTHGAMKKLLQEKGVKYTLVEVPGYGHEWKFWRLSLRDLLPRLFQ